MQEEILDIVSETDQVIGNAPRSVIYEKSLNFRAINGFIINEQGQLWIPRRHHDKKLWPLHFDASVGGHVSSGETYDQAFVRETQEELGLDVTTLNYKIIARLTPPQDNTSAFMYVYLIKYNEIPPYNPLDFVESFWLSPQKLLQQINEGQKAKSDLVKIVKHILPLL